MKIINLEFGCECQFENGTSLLAFNLLSLVKQLKSIYGCTTQEIQLAMFNPNKYES